MADDGRTEIADDGLVIPKVGSWAEKKYRLVGTYAGIFARSMKNKWHARVYIDLFVGAGYARIKETGRIVYGSPLIALKLPEQFDTYIFCERSCRKMSALKARVMREYPETDIHFIHGNTNDKIDEIIATIPQPKTDFKVLSFCFVDPYNVRSIAFQTIRKLSGLFVDFLILLPTSMDIKRNLHFYLEESDRSIEYFTGVPEWRHEWRTAERTQSFGVFVADLFIHQMKELGYIYTELPDMEEVRTPTNLKNLPLYHLAFFSRHKLAQKFWKEAQKSTDPQLKLLL